jgi:hypothetical protein
MTTSLSTTPTRDEVLGFLFAASSYGNLGLFVGAGFSMAALSSDDGSPALSWGALLNSAAKKMKIDLAPLEKEGASYPDVASALCGESSEVNGVTFQESTEVLKQALSEATAWFPHEPGRSEFAGYLKAINPSWIVTTNYDQVLECLLSGKSASLGPNEAFSCPKGLIPIIHLHGARTAPQEIIITQEDYVALFRPTEYRQIRLALAIKESTMCLLGYGLGDVNVLTALDWSRYVYEKAAGNYPHEVIQVVRNASPANSPRRSKDGIVIIEVGEIADFFKEYLEVSAKLQTEEEQKRKNLKKIAKMFAAAEPDSVQRFIDDNLWRRGILQALSLFSVDLVADFESFLESCFKETKKRSGKNRAFHEYATDLHITLDILTAFPFKDFPPALFPLAATNLDRLAKYIGTGMGFSWAANDVWNARKGELQSETVSELKTIALRYYHTALKGLLKSI